MKEYLVIYERADGNWSAYSPDVPGCIATGKTRDDVERNYQAAIEFHLEGLRQECLPIPEPVSDAGRVTVAA
jgi:predicted RNase H-like HicB family nuclease